MDARHSPGLHSARPRAGLSGRVYFPVQPAQFPPERNAVLPANAGLARRACDNIQGLCDQLTAQASEAEWENRSEDNAKNPGYTCRKPPLA